MEPDGDPGHLLQSCLAQTQGGLKQCEGEPPSAAFRLWVKTRPHYSPSGWSENIWYTYFCFLYWLHFKLHAGLREAHPTYLGESIGKRNLDMWKKSLDSAQRGTGLGSCLLGLFGGICLSLAALLLSKQDLAQSSSSSYAKTAIQMLIMWCNYVCMADHGFVLLELGALMASLKCVNSEDRTSKYLSQIIGLNITAGQKCFLNKMNFRRKL